MTNFSEIEVTALENRGWSVAEAAAAKGNNTITKQLTETGMQYCFMEQSSESTGNLVTSAPMNFHFHPSLEALIAEHNEVL